MYKIKYMFILILLLFLVINTNAQMIYHGLDYVNINYSETGGYEADLKAVRYKLGILATPNIAFEGQFAVGIDDDTFNILGVDVNVEIDNGFGIYILGILPIEEKSKVYAIAGYTHGKAKAKVPSMGLSYSDSESDLSYGIGGEILFLKRFSATIEYAQFIDKPDLEYSGLSIGIKMYF